MEEGKWKMSEVPLEHLNQSELLELLRLRGTRLNRAVSADRLIHLLRSGEAPQLNEYSGTLPSRRRLELWVDKNKAFISSQLPCKGELQGRCTIYNCSDGRHLDCYLTALQGGHLL